MSSITAQQTKLDLELVPKENRLDIRKCNGRIPCRLTPRGPTFKVVLDAIALTHAILHFSSLLMSLKVQGRDFDALPSEEVTVSFLREIGLTRIYGAILPGCLTSLEMKESKAYKTFLGYAIGAVPPKIARNFKKASPSKKDSNLVPIDEEPVTKGKRVKRSVKKSSTKPATGIVIRKPPLETKSKRKEKVDVTRGKGIDMLSKVALTKEAQMKEVIKKSLRDFHKTHPSGSGTIAEKPPRVEKITPIVTSEGTSDKRGVPDVTENDSTENESESWGNDEDDNNDENDSKNEGNDEENKSDDNKTPSDSEKGLDSKQDTDGSESDSESDQQEYEEVKDDDEEENEIETEVPDASFSHSSDLASKLLNFSDIHPNDAEIISPLDVHAHHDVARIYISTLLTVPVSTTPIPPPTIETTNITSIIPDFASVFQFNKKVSALEKDVAKLKKDPLHIQEVSNFASRVIEKMIEESLNQVNLAKVSSQPQSTYAGAATPTEFELKKILIDKMNKSKSFLTAPEHRECYNGLIKSYNLDKDFFTSYDVYSLKRSQKDKDKDEDPSAGSDKGIKKRKTSKDTEPTTLPEFEVADTDMPQDQGGNLGNDDDEPRKESASKHDWFTKPIRPQEPTNLDWNVGKTPKKGPTESWLLTLAASSSTDKSLKSFDELMITPIDFSAYIMNGLKISYLTQEILLGPAFRLLKGTRRNYPFDLTKPLPLVKAGNRQKVPADYFFNNDLKYLQGGISTMTYTTSLTNIWSHVKVSLIDMLNGVFVIGELNDMLILVAQNRLTDLLGDDVADFAIALKMFTRSLVIQKRFEDLQLGVKSYQKKINVTRPDTVRPDLWKTHPYTPYQDAQGFIYVDSLERNKLMHSDELYKFSDGTLTRLLTSLEDITKNIHMRYLPKIRWSSLEKKRAHFMIKEINKLLKERRMMWSLEKFIGGRLYNSDP
nr:hypothetical protein [Tanacetum cinerariifolium]